MADSIWTDGGATGAFETDANYLGSHPGVGDNLIYDGRTATNVAGDLDHATAELLGEVRVGKLFTGDIGTVAEPLMLSAGSVFMRGSGHLFFENGSVSNTTRVIIDTESGAATIGCNTDGIAGIFANEGTVVLTSTLTGLATLFVGNAHVTIQGANTIALVHMFGSGNVESLVPVTSLVNAGSGTFTHMDAATGAVGTMRIGSRATVRYNSTDTIARAEVYGEGTLDTGNWGGALVITQLIRSMEANILRRDSLAPAEEIVL